VVKWNGVPLGLVTQRDFDKGQWLTYKFNAGTPNAGDACPEGFSLGVFAADRGFANSAFLLSRSEGKEYLHATTREAAFFLLCEYADGIERQSEGADSAARLREDVEDIQGNPSIPATVKQRLVDARLGQGKFRRDLVRVFGGRCAVSGMSVSAALRASHVLPWRESDNVQRLDPNNGLLLTANLDALFDKHLISFDKGGQVLVSKTIAAPDLESLHVFPLRARPTAAQWCYLQRHVERFEQLERGRKPAA
jgi:hypothetical protein